MNQHMQLILQNTGKSSLRFAIRHGNTSGIYTRTTYKGGKVRWTIAYDKGVNIEVNEFRQKNPNSKTPTAEQIEKAFQDATRNDS